MTENQNSKVDPIAIRELISQGIPMKRKESEMIRSQSEEQGVESERSNDEPISKDFSRVARHIGRDSHVYEEQGYDHRHLCGEHHPSSS